MNSHKLMWLLAISSVLLLLPSCKCTHATPAVNQRVFEHWKPVTLSLNEMVAPATAESSELIRESTGGAQTRSAETSEPEQFSGLDFELSTDITDADAASDSAAEEESRVQLTRMEVELALRLEAIRAAIDEARVKTRAENKAEAEAATATEEEADEEAENKRATSQHTRDAGASGAYSHFEHKARAQLRRKNDQREERSVPTRKHKA